MNPPLLDRLLIRAQELTLRGDTEMAAKLLAEHKRISEAKARRAKWLAEMLQKAKGANEHKNKITE